MNQKTRIAPAVAAWPLITARAKAYLVHLYTASAMIILLVATTFLLNGQLTAALFTMLLTIVIDSTDGFLARRCKVKQHVPEYDGRTMDDVIDYVSYVFLPVVFLLKAEMLLAPAAFFGAFPLIASAFGFARVDAKLDNDGFFIGFPSYWNIVAAYFYLTGSPPWLNSLIIIFLAVMVFVPTRYIYITRFPRFRAAHFAGASVSGVTLLGALLTTSDLRTLLILISLIYPIYYTIYSFLLDYRARKAAR
jgi:phosphatidylcholine synthase